MRVTNRNLRGREGEISVTAETLDDLWHLKYIIETGDLVFALTKRKADAASDKLRPEKIEKKNVRLGLRVDGLEFHRFSNRLRVHGVIEHGMDIGQHHTFNVEEGTNLSIIKTWKKDQLERIDEAESLFKTTQGGACCCRGGGCGHRSCAPLRHRDVFSHKPVLR